MPNPFDGFQNGVFDTVTNVMGETANWTPSTGGGVQTCLVLFNDPTQVKKFINPEYDPIHPMIEYRRDFFDSLKTNVDNGLNEIVVINSVEFFVRDVTAHWDGKTYRATLVKK